jgi:hypothetical protein
MPRAPALLPLIVSLCLVVPVHRAGAHHTFVIKYDPAKVIRLSGVVTSVDYSNPHIHFSLQVGGTSWTVESESISVAQSSGLTQSVLKAGAKVTVSGWPARDGSAAMGLHTISVAGGPSATMRRTAR